MDQQQPAGNVNMMITRYAYSALTEDDRNYSSSIVTVEYRGGGRWAVCHAGMCLGADGDWDAEVRVGDRPAVWRRKHRFDLATAQDLASKAAVEVSAGPVADATEGGRKVIQSGRSLLTDVSCLDCGGTLARVADNTAGCDNCGSAFDLARLRAAAVEVSAGASPTTKKGE